MSCGIFPSSCDDARASNSVPVFLQLQSTLVEQGLLWDSAVIAARLFLQRPLHWCMIAQASALLKLFIFAAAEETNTPMRVGAESTRG